MLELNFTPQEKKRDAFEHNHSKLIKHITFNSVADLEVRGVIDLLR